MAIAAARRTRRVGRPVPLREYRDRHAGESVVVCGCGTSLLDLPDPRRWVTIGVNDIGRHFDPTYLVVLNPRPQFRDDRYRYVEQSGAEAIFTQLNLEFPHPQIVRFRLGQRGGTDISGPDRLPYTRNSPYVAVCLAAFMGARRIGLIGVDFTDHHFFGKTGRHPLTRELAQIDHEYAGLAEALAGRGIELVNLSHASRLQSLEKQEPANFLKQAGDAVPAPGLRLVPGPDRRRVFFVHYQFLSCGDVFRVGLERAARTLGLQCAHASVDDPHLAGKVEGFAPGLVFVVHGRTFRKKWGRRLRRYRKAVWLLDEPYEVDDTVRTSELFDTVFVNDPATLERHRNAHYLPVAFDPEVHFEDGIQGAVKKYDVGFIGGHNPSRERMLLALAGAGRLSYVVGGPWRSPDLRRLCRSSNIPPAETAALYRQTRIVVNVFRDLHHYNREGIEARSLNPRVYEALACGALVVSEPRPEVTEVFPELPTFRSDRELLEVTERFLENGEEAESTRLACVARLEGHSYVDRLRRVLELTANGGPPEEKARPGGKAMATNTEITEALETVAPGWLDYGGISRIDDRTVRFEKEHDDAPASELGLVSEHPYGDVAMSFEVKADPETCFIAKLHQKDRYDQATNSYHLYSHPGRSYLGMHGRILHNAPLERGDWQHVGLSYRGGRIQVTVNGDLVASITDGRLRRGFCFLGVKGGVARVRNIALTRPRDHFQVRNRQGTEPAAGMDPEDPGSRILYEGDRSVAPSISVITSVYDRVHCLRNCIDSLRHSRCQDFEHIVVSDNPPESIVRAITRLMAGGSLPRSVYANLEHRFNNWGISPAAAGLRMAKGRYVCFLSDDNGFAPDHLGGLAGILDRDPSLGFAYSSCRYAGRIVLRHHPPSPGAIDLGQPLFRRELFEKYLGGTLPFDMFAWDWHMIERFLQNGVEWRHLDRPTFLFRLEDCRRRWGYP